MAGLARRVLLQGLLRVLFQALLQALLPALALLLAAAPARADTALRLYKTYNGAVNFTGTQVTLRTRSNSGDACAVTSAKTERSASLTLPANSTVLSAQLYWAGSGSPDNSVKFEGKTVTATRKYTSNTVGGGMTYFGGAADVTDAVKANKTGTFRFSDLTVSNGRPWCASQAVLGGFSLMVVYANKSEPERILNLYEGFVHVQNSSVTLTATNFRWNRTWVPVRERARIGHITWEGDSTLLGDGERLLFEGNEVTDDMNTAGNQFNSKSNINRDSLSYGIDFDAYDTEVVIWAGYAPSVTTTYRTGQDLVLLSAEILVLPTLPVSDLSIEMSRGGSMEVGQQANYTIVVANNGPYTEAGPISLVDTLPAGMSYVSGTGTGWECAASGQAVTCRYTGALAPGDSAPPLTIVANVNQTGPMTNTAQVTGTSDNVAANNTATNTGNATAGSNAGYVFTSVPCAPGKKVGSNDCPRYNAALTGGTTAKIYVTAVNGDTTVTPNAKNETTVSMQFSQSCVNPANTAGVKASYAGVTLPTCTAGGAMPATTAMAAWSTPVGLKFAANSASAAVTAAHANFSYADVGEVELNLLANGRTASTAFVSRPLRLGIRSVTTRTGVAAPEAPTPGGLGFARAGEEFVVAIGAVLADGAYAPNFGNEQVAPLPKFDDSIPAEFQQWMPNDKADLSPALLVNAGSGTVAASMSYNEVGIIAVQPSLASYLTTGRVDGPARTVGRFYPAWYTTVAEASTLCTAAMRCPDATDNGEDGANLVVSGAVYAGEPFGVSVNAFNMNGDQLKNYVGPWRREITLSAVAAPGGGPAPRALVGGALGSDLVDGVAIARMQGTPNYAFDSRYNANPPAVPLAQGKPGATDTTVPTAIYVRATSSESVVGNKTVVVTSNRGDDDDSDEDGVMVLSGRLNVASVQGVNTFNTRMALQAEYWSGQAWVRHAAPEGTVIDPRLALYTGCAGGLKLAAAPPNTAANPNRLQNCNGDHVGAGRVTPIMLDGAAPAFWFGAPGAGRGGSAWVQMRGPDWLPSTRGRISFGAARRAVIYLREVY